VPATLETGPIKDCIMHRSHKHQAALPRWKAARNRLISPIRAAVERVFGTLKRSYGYHRVRCRGLAANRLQLRFLCIAVNLRKAVLQLAEGHGASTTACNGLQAAPEATTRDETRLIGGRQDAHLHPRAPQEATPTRKPPYAKVSMYTVSA
jgi:hypothetical protein